MKRKELYPGTTEARKEAERSARKAAYAAPDLVQTVGGIAPNYDAFPGWTAERVLAWCNMD